MISLRQLHYFVAAAQAGSATRAAERLNVSQPSISTAIRELEGQFGQPLFERRQALGLELTRFGVEKLAEARLVLDRMEHFATVSGAGPSPRLSLAYFATIGPSCLPPVLARLLREMPQLQVDLRECDLDALSRSLEKGIVDLALTYDVGLPASISREVLVEYQPHAVMAADHLLARQPDVSLAELAQHPFILVDLPLSREFLMVPFWQQGLSPNVILRTASVEMVHSMAANGLGVSMLFSRSRNDMSRDGKPVACLPIRDAPPGQRLVAAYASGTPVTAAAKAALSIIRSHFSGTDEG